MIHLLKQIFGVTTLNWFNFLLAFFVQAFLARQLGPESYAVWGLTIAVIDICLSLSFPDFSRGPTVHSGSKRAFDCAFVLSIIFGSLSVIISSLVIINILDLSKLILFIAILLIFVRVANQIASIFIAYTEQSLKFIRIDVIKAFAKLIAYLVVCCLSLFYQNAAILFCIEIISICLSIPFLIMSSSYFVKRLTIDKSTIKFILVYSLNRLHNRLIDTINARIPMLFVSNITSQTNTGYFERSNYVSHLPSTVTAPFHSRVAFYLFGSRNRHIADPDLLYDLSSVVLCRLSIFAAVVLCRYNFETVELLLGSQWQPVAYLLPNFAGLIITFANINLCKQVLFARNSLRPLTFLNYFIMLSKLLIFYCFYIGIIDLPDALSLMSLSYFLVFCVYNILVSKLLSVEHILKNLITTIFYILIVSEVQIGHLAAVFTVVILFVDMPKLLRSYRKIREC